ncbi:nucleotidyltransferase domain-containing protein [Nanoarchaeota archaeon]
MVKKKKAKKLAMKPIKISQDPKKIARSLKLTSEREMAQDFAQKVYQKMGKVIKSVILFGSAAKGTSKAKSDIDVVILVDDATVQWDQELIAWYREELGKILVKNPYAKPIHVSTVRITTWWSEMMRGEPVVVNIIRWGLPLIDFGGFFAPLKSLLAQGKIKSTPEMIYITLGRSPIHMVRCKTNLISALESLYWAFIDSSHAALIAAKVSPPSPEHIPAMLKEHLVEPGFLKKRYIEWYRDIYTEMHKVLHGEVTDVDGEQIQEWRERADEYIREMALAIKQITGRI